MRGAGGEGTDRKNSKKMMEEQAQEDVSQWVEQAAREGIALKLVDQDRGWARAYRVWLQHTLWGGVNVIREWGRLGTVPHHPRRLVHHCPDEAAARTILRTVLLDRWRRGYTLHTEDS
jgi:predicted DNA-binding WGR domain protein